MDRQCKKSCPMDGFEWRKYLFRLDEKFIQDYDEDSDKGYILEVDVSQGLHKLHSDLPVLFKRMEIEKCEKLVYNLYDKKNT